MKNVNTFTPIIEGTLTVVKKEKPKSDGEKKSDSEKKDK